MAILFQPCSPTSHFHLQPIYVNSVWKVKTPEIQLEYRLHMSYWMLNVIYFVLRRLISFRFSGSLPPHKNMPVGGLVTECARVLSKNKQDKTISEDEWINKLHITCQMFSMALMGLDCRQVSLASRLFYYKDMNYHSLWSFYAAEDELVLLKQACLFPKECLRRLKTGKCLHYCQSRYHLHLSCSAQRQFAFYHSPILRTAAGQPVCQALVPTFVRVNAVMD